MERPGKIKKVDSTSLSLWNFPNQSASPLGLIYPGTNIKLLYFKREVRV